MKDFRLLSGHNAIKRFKKIVEYQGATDERERILHLGIYWIKDTKVLALRGVRMPDNFVFIATDQTAFRGGD